MKNLTTKSNKHRLPTFLFHAITEAVVPMPHNASVDANTATTLQQRKKTLGELALIFKSTVHSAISSIRIYTRRASNISLNRTRKERVPVSSDR